MDTCTEYSYTIRIVSDTDTGVRVRDLLKTSRNWKMKIYTQEKISRQIFRICGDDNS